ncbi:MAG: hypothetical protein KAV83_06490 [Desulfobacterales bacterium]|nr:hypothetical protein [Desulfobacterales bacterium]
MKTVLKILSLAMVLAVGILLWRGHLFVRSAENTAGDVPYARDKAIVAKKTAEDPASQEICTYEAEGSPAALPPFMDIPDTRDKAIIAQNTSGDVPSSEEICIEEAEGAATILPPFMDIPNAREKAIIAAEMEALMQCGHVIEGGSFVENMMGLEHWVRIKTFGMVEDRLVLSERQNDGIYRVRICAKVKLGQAAAESQRELLSRQTLLMLAEGRCAQLAEDELKQMLTTGGYFLYDTDFIRANVGSGIWTALRSGRMPPQGETNELSPVDFLITIRGAMRFSQKNDEIKSYRAEGNITLTQLSRNRLMIARSMSALVFGLDEDQARESRGPNGYYARILEPLIADFTEALRVQMGQRRREIRIQVNNLPDRAAFMRFINRARAVRWVEDFRNEHFVNGTGSFSVTYLEKLIWLVASLDNRTTFRATSWREGLIVFEYRQ